MKKMEMIGHQGDLVIFSIDDIPEGTKVVDKQCEDKTLAYGELSGHAHQFEANAAVEVFKIPGEYDGLIFVQPKVDTVLRHGRDRNFKGKEADLEYHSELLLKGGQNYVTGIVEETDWLTRTVRRVID